MSGVLARVVGAFVAPAEDPALGWQSRLPAPPAEWEEPATAGALPAAGSPVVVVSAARDVALAGAALGLALAERRRARCALVVEWTGAAPRPMVARPSRAAARRCAAALSAEGSVAVSCGRLVRTALPAAEPAAAAAAERVAAAACGAPTVLALGGPRGAEVEALIAAQGAVLLASRPEADGALASIALAELAELVPSAGAVELPASPVAAALARAGLMLAAPLRGPVLDALDGLGAAERAV